MPRLEQEELHRVLSFMSSAKDVLLGGEINAGITLESFGSSDDLVVIIRASCGRFKLDNWTLVADILNIRLPSTDHGSLIAERMKEELADAGAPVISRDRQQD